MPKFGNGHDNVNHKEKKIKFYINLKDLIKKILKTTFIWKYFKVFKRQYFKF